MINAKKSVPHRWATFEFQTAEYQYINPLHRDSQSMSNDQFNCLQKGHPLIPHRIFLGKLNWMASSQG